MTPGTWAGLVGFLLLGQNPQGLWCFLSLILVATQRISGLWLRLWGQWCDLRFSAPLLASGMILTLNHFPVLSKSPFAPIHEVGIITSPSRVIVKMKGSRVFRVPYPCLKALNIVRVESQKMAEFAGGVPLGQVEDLPHTRWVARGASHVARW